MLCGLVAESSVRSFVSKLSAAFVDVSSMSCRRYSSTALSTVFPTTPAIGTMNRVLDSTFLTVLSATAFSGRGWPSHLRIL